jgi:hypothetical protein
VIVDSRHTSSITEASPALPSTWLSRSMRVAYTDGSEIVETTGVLLDACPMGAILDLAGEKTILAWSCLNSLTLIND